MQHRRGGSWNHATGNDSTVSGGSFNQATGLNSSVAGGQSNAARGDWSTIAGGFLNFTSGPYSFAAGYAAYADQQQCFVFANWSSQTQASCLSATNIARFLLDHGLSVDYYAPRSDGGGTRYVYFGDLSANATIATWNGAYLSDAGVWVNASSSKTRKTDFRPVDVQAVLHEVARLPITTWRYKEGEGDVRHIGPMAEDFWAAFHIGYGDTTIADLDARGVALASIQGLHQLVQEKDREIAELKRKLEVIEARLGLH